MKKLKEYTEDFLNGVYVPRKIRAIVIIELQKEIAAFDNKKNKKSSKKGLNF
jgi:hypothetical protein